MRNTLIWLAILFPAVTFSVTVDEIPALLERNNDELKAARADEDAADAGVWAARARLVPQLSLHNTYVLLNDDITLKIPPREIGPVIVDLPPLQIQKRDVFLSSLRLAMPLWTGGRISAGINGAKAQRDEMRV